LVWFGMTLISGYVKVKETNEAVPGLIVSVYVSVEKETKGRGVGENPFQYFKNSLGSALTDARGEFKIELGPWPGTSSKEGEQADLMIAVFAPLAAKSAKLLSAPTPMERLLHWATLPPMISSQSEACAILLLQEQLQQHGIKLRSDRPKLDIDKRVALLVETEEESDRFRAALREGLAPIRKKRFERRRDIKARAKRFAASIHATPKAVREHVNFAKSKDDAKAKLQSAVERSINEMAEAATKNPEIGMISVHLDDSEKKQLGIEAGPGMVEPARTYLDLDQMCQLLHMKRGGTELARVRGLLDARKAKADAEKLLGEGEETTEAGAGTEEPEPSEGELEPAAVIRQQVLGQFSDLQLEGLESDGSRPGLWTPDKLKEVLPAVQYPSPSDEAAFHDFHHLQIAFKHVWVEAFDNNARANIEEIFSDMLDSGLTLQTPDEQIELDELFQFLADIEGRDIEIIPAIVTISFGKLITQSDWNQLSLEQRRDVQIYAMIYKKVRYGLPSDFTELEKALMGPILEWGGPERIKEEVLNQVLNIAVNPAQTRLARLLTETLKILNGVYAFHYFAPNTVNFGLLLTYRQLWQPGPYQVGDLVATIPLAPGEKRKYETKTIIKRTRAQTELEKGLISKSREVSGTRRAESEIFEKASMTSNFKMTAEGTFQIGIAELTSSSEFSLNQAQESSRIKKDFHEAVMKAAQEYKQERSLQVETKDERTSETTTSGELSNPNNELTVTYLLYELERQYVISERIHRVTPVVLVAQDMPAPHEITESWLLAHDWILRRVLLDDSLVPALDYLTDAFGGEELSVLVKKANWEMHRDLLANLQVTVNDLLSAQEKLRTKLIASEESLAQAQAIEEAQGWLTDFVENLTFGDLGEAAIAEAEAKVKSVQKMLGFLEEGLSEKREELGLAKEALEEITKTYTAALEAQTNRRIAIDQLRIHVKENILYYMQAIWDHEPPDQRFFRLYHIDVELPESAERAYILRSPTQDELDIGIPTVEQGGIRYIVEVKPPRPPNPERPNKRALVEIADVDHPLGYKGNYIIFPLKKCLHLTNFMMCQFFDDYFGVRDPDVAANMSVEELLTYAEDLMKDTSEPLTEDQRAALTTIVMTKLRQPRRESDLIVVPTGELYMEALLGSHVLMENFKLNHRFFDMAKARAEWREAELENLRRAARLLKEDPDLEDPDVDKCIVVEGKSDVHVEIP